MGWKVGFGGGVVDFVGHVGEEGAARGDAFHPTKGRVKMGVAGVRLGAEGVENEDVEVPEERQAGFGDGAHVGEIGGGAEAEAGDLEVAMEDGHALEGDAEDFGGLGIFEWVELNAGAMRVRGVGGEGVVEDVAKDGRGGLVGVEGQEAGLVGEAERAEVVEAEDVVGMGVGVEDGVEVMDALANGLLAEVGAGIDDDGMRPCTALPADGDGRASAAVARVSGGTHGAPASQGGDAHGGSAAEEYDLRIHQRAGYLIFPSGGRWAD